MSGILEWARARIPLLIAALILVIAAVMIIVVSLATGH